MTIDPSIALASRVLLLLVFGSAVLGKLRHRAEFSGVIANYRLLPRMLVEPAAWLVIAMEAAVVVSLTTGVAMIPGTLLAIGLLCVFAVAITVNLARGRRNIDCGCFQSALRQRLSVSLVARNVALVGIAVPLLGSASAWSSIFADVPGPYTLSLLQIVDGVGAGAALFILYQCLDQALALRDAAAALRERAL